VLASNGGGASSMCCPLPVHFLRRSWRLLAVESCGPVSQLHHPSGAPSRARCHRLIVGSSTPDGVARGGPEGRPATSHKPPRCTHRGENLCDTDYMAIEARARYNRDLPATSVRCEAAARDVQSTGAERPARSVTCRLDRGIIRERAARSRTMSPSAARTHHHVR